jgi:hypothetical protein
LGRVVAKCLLALGCGAQDGQASATAGLAEVRIAGGAYQLHVWKADYETPPTALHIRADTSVEVEAVPEEDPDAR